MADEAVRAPALGGVTERLDAQYDAHGADDDDVPITRSEGTKQLRSQLQFLAMRNHGNLRRNLIIRLQDTRSL